MDTSHPGHTGLESRFDINKVSFNNVSRDFEHKFRSKYDWSLSMMSDAKDPLTNASGVNTLQVLERLAHKIPYFDRNTDFEKSYHDFQRESEPFTET